MLTHLNASSNSLWTKFQGKRVTKPYPCIDIHLDMQCVENCSDPDPAKRVYYEQPVWQTLHMFIGELGCKFSHQITSVDL
jgi:hypothetical protein